MTDITYDQATAAQKLSDAITRFGIRAKLINPDLSPVTVLQAMQVLDDALGLLERLRTESTKTGVKVDIFWERQGWYFHEVANPRIVSAEYEDMDDCIRAAHDQGYTIRDVRRTRGHVKQPPVPQRKPSDAE
jgi:hypothetical protein